MKFGIIREGKVPPDRRVVFSPQELLNFKNQFPQAKFKIEPSDIRVFSDDAYADAGFDVQADLSDCDVLLGVKEVPIDDLIPNKTYFFFSHTIKKQPYNKELLQACLEKKIRLIDHETLVDEKGNRLIGFGRYAGIVGAYNTFRTFGKQFDLFHIQKAENLSSQKDLIDRLKKLSLPPIKVVLTGKGKVGCGAKEMLVGMKMKEVSAEDFLTKKYSHAVYTHINYEQYYRRIDGSPMEKQDYFAHPEWFESDFEKYAQVADIFIAGHFYQENTPYILTQEMLKSTKNTIKVVGDISCDIDGPIAPTIRPSTIAEPFYGYNPRTHQEVPLSHPEAIGVMAVDNLPCELPKDASEGFGKCFLEKIIPAFFNNDADGVLKRATICENGQLTERFNYLTDYAEI